MLTVSGLNRSPLGRCLRLLREASVGLTSPLLGGCNALCMASCDGRGTATRYMLSCLRTASRGRPGVQKLADALASLLQASVPV